MSRAEEARLRQLYGLRDEAVIARELKRPVAGFRRMAQRLFQEKAKSGKQGLWASTMARRLSFVACGQRRLSIRVSLAGSPGRFAVSLSRP